MIVTIKNGEMIVQHPSGHVDRYTKNDLERFRDKRQDRINKMNGEIVNYNFDIAQIENS